MRVLSIVLGALVIMSLSGCFLFQPYKIQIQQGHVITAHMIQELKPGMTEAQVQYILGTPDIQDSMHPDVWYYVYTNEANYMPRVQKHLTVYFKNGQLDHMDGDYAPPAALQDTPSVTTS